MEFADLKNKTTKEIHDILNEKREELRELRFKANENQLKNVRAIRQARKLIAQVLTLLNKKKVQIEKQEDKKVQE